MPHFLDGYVPNEEELTYVDMDSMAEVLEKAKKTLDNAKFNHL